MLKVLALCCVVMVSSAGPIDVHTLFPKRHDLNHLKAKPGSPFNSKCVFVEDHSCQKQLFFRVFRQELMEPFLAYGESAQGLASHLLPWRYSETWLTIRMVGEHKIVVGGGVFSVLNIEARNVPHLERGAVAAVPYSKRCEHIFA